MNEIINQIEYIIREIHKITIRIIGFYDFRSNKETIELLKKINDLITQNEL